MNEAILENAVKNSIRKAAEKYADKYVGEEKTIAYASFLEGMYYATILMEDEK